METINWEAIQAVSEALGLVVVVGSLIFVGFQIRQNAQATRAASMNNIMDTFSDRYLRISENENLAEVVWNGAQDPKAVNGVDRWRLSIAIGGFFYFWNNAYYQWTIGAYESHAWYAHEKLMTNLLTMSGIRAVWDERKSMLPEDFQMYVETEILTKSPDADYKLPGT